jgi:uncharacterized cupredoxin-like copper-binding protein
MKKTIVMLMFGVLPAVALASGDHTGGHDMEPMERSSHDMHGMSQHVHEAEADAGRPGDPAKVNRTIEVSMNDTMRFDPAEMKFKAGETVRFVVRNEGKIRHEMVIGTVEELKEHAEMMRKMPGMQHAEPNMISLAPGESGDLVWRFDDAGAFDFACLVPGHLEAGMMGSIQVNR